MIKIEELSSLLKLKESETSKMTIEQLRLLLGVLRYSTRIVQRELNSREELNSVGVAKKISA
jgi:hypothetical protein